MQSFTGFYNVDEVLDDIVMKCNDIISSVLSAGDSTELLNTLRKCDQDLFVLREKIEVRKNG